MYWFCYHLPRAFVSHKLLPFGKAQASLTLLSFIRRLQLFDFVHKFEDNFTQFCQ